MSSITKYHYTECGLDNIYVQGITVEADDGTNFIRIPNLGELHCLIAQALLEEPRPLTGSELYFLRAEIGMGIEQIARQLEVDLEDIKDWESNHQVSNTLDFAFRAFFKNMYQQQLSQKTSCWKQSIAIPTSYNPSNGVTEIKIHYGDDNCYHRDLVA